MEEVSSFYGFHDTSPIVLGFKVYGLYSKKVFGINSRRMAFPTSWSVNTKWNMDHFENFNLLSSLIAKISANLQTFKNSLIENRYIHYTRPFKRALIFTMHTFRINVYFDSF